ncbi:hypothetical protein GCM10012275_43330 [Longimycelium tulufanense]|uniref:Carbohydrate kinase PfkB domain-containing protein n=1 Tax=Longimycelium tulufanense TaxID=907463 RepID=A0A8J3FY27_9PSEU|nr:hypothetical protein GCM10012275_43330 [Longimycelium tulufanense]
MVANQVGQAPRLAADLFHRLGPDAAIVTLGRFGALAHTTRGLLRTPAPTVTVVHTHGAGAAFSAGYAQTLLAGATLPEALHAGCTLGSAHCAGSPVTAIQPTPTPNGGPCVIRH